MKSWFFVGVVLVIGICADSAQAHPRSVSYSNWEINGRHARVQVSITALDANALQLLVSSLGEDVITYLQRSILLMSGSTPCQAHDGLHLQSAEWIRFEWQLDCPTQTGLHIRNHALFGVIAAHIHFASVRLSDSAQARDFVLTDDTRDTPTIEGSHPLEPGETVSMYFRLGVEHISTGWDHLAFLLVLLLGLAYMRTVVLAVTGFTFGHSLTLILATTGLATPHLLTVEALIALSIVLVAVENIWTARKPYSFWLPLGTVGMLAVLCLLVHFLKTISIVALVGVTLFSACYFALVGRANQSAHLKIAFASLFGLLHGFGFASALGPLRIQTDELVVALASFNVGVEAGQLVVVLVSLPVLWSLSRWARTPSRLVGSWIAAGLGTFWFVSRVIA